MNLKPIKDYEGLYSFDLNTNQVWAHKKKKYKKLSLINKYYNIQLIKNKKKYNLKFHRLVYEGYNSSIPEGMLIDHIDGNTKNNNLSNLRLATRNENSFNQKIHKNNKTGYKNISLTKSNTYLVLIRKNNKVGYCKCFKTLEEAIENRNIQLVLLHGEFHNLGS
jgi:hypothetical protein